MCIVGFQLIRTEFWYNSNVHYISDNKSMTAAFFHLLVQKIECLRQLLITVPSF